VDNITIHVDVEAQRDLFAKHGLLDAGGIPTFPLNTDGIDASGNNISITRSTITCFDDAVAVKPLHRGESIYPGHDCTSDVRIVDMDVILGVGISMGSVPPNRNHACISGVTASGIRFHTPIKAI